MERSGKLVIYIVLLLALFYGVRNVFIGNIFEIPFVVLLAALTMMGFFNWKRSLGEKLLFFVSLFFMVYLLLVWFVNESLYLTLLFLSLILFMLSFPRRKRQTKTIDEGEPTVSEQLHSVVFEPPQTENKSTPESVTKVFSPGLYVASSNGSVYHSPTCNWAKKVAEARRVWLQSKDDAKGKGYSEHTCVKVN